MTPPDRRRPRRMTRRDDETTERDEHGNKSSNHMPHENEAKNTQEKHIGGKARYDETHDEMRNEKQDETR